MAKPITTNSITTAVVAACHDWCVEIASGVDLDGQVAFRIMPAKLVPGSHGGYLRDEGGKHQIAAVGDGEYAQFLEELRGRRLVVNAWDFSHRRRILLDKIHRMRSEQNEPGPEHVPAGDTG